MRGEAVQIVSTTDSEGGPGFECTPALGEILSRVPGDCTVSVLSVVGGFRTGKSFLLSLFLRYLRHDGGDDESVLDESWLHAEGEFLREGNLNEGESVGEGSADEGQGHQGSSGFPWRGGQNRQTLGIWMWSEPFIRKSSLSGRVALLLMDTQVG